MRYKTFRQLLKALRKSFDNPKNTTKKFSTSAQNRVAQLRSEYFRAAFSNNWAEKKDGMLIFKKPNIESNLFRIILRFIYCGDVDLTKLQGPEVLKLLIAVDENS
ncbi:BTB/POZ protein [Rhizophagus irregularis DAOM 181602=DAOM 197198]|nr:BTB/POZ protein [Rhizophagus irregularis DAOM 181602=DAOM 197198]